MATRQTISALFPSVARPSRPAAFICGPCQHQLQRHLLQQRQKQQPQTRGLHQHIKPSPPPSPTPFVPDVATFLTLIGRNLSTHAAKFTTWTSLFTSTSSQLKELGIEPARSRRYLLRWREKFRRGEYGIGGDFKYVQDGQGELRVIEVPSLEQPQHHTEAATTTAASVTKTPGMTKLILNVPNGEKTYRLEAGETTRDLKKPAFVTLRDGHVIAGTHVQPAPGGNGDVAVLKVKEGLWEDRRGHKVFGGERRRAETLHKLRVAERKKNAR